MDVFKDTKRYRLGGGGGGGGGGEQIDSVNMANVLMLLSQGGGGGGGGGVEKRDHSGRVFECKTCNRQFPSFQALGGHRASHKKPRLGGDGHGQAQGGAAKPRVHECSICGLEFAIGQALGGHMRRHRVTAEGFGHGLTEKPPGDRRGTLLDLNLPPLENDLKLGLGLEIVDKIPMVGCGH